MTNTTQQTNNINNTSAVQFWTEARAAALELFQRANKRMDKEENAKHSREVKSGKIENDGTALIAAGIAWRRAKASLKHADAVLDYLSFGLSEESAVARADII